MVSKIQKPIAAPVRAPAAKEAPAPAPASAAAASASAKGWAPKAAAARPATASAKPAHPMLEKLGEAVGRGLGVVVTEGLRLAPGWDKPVLDAGGKPVESVTGAVREGDYEIRKRHEEVIGPQLAEKAAQMKPGVLHDLVEGLAEGASRAPGDSYRIDAAIDHALHPGAKKPSKG